jgi:predicted nucleotidyltransferase
VTPLPPDGEVAIEQLAAALSPATVVLVGASAIDRHLPLTWRKTNDLDIVAAIELDTFHGLADKLPGWSPSRSEHAWTSPQGSHVDILPAGPSLLANGSLTFPRSGNTMTLIGLDLAFAHAEALQVRSQHIGVAPLPVLLVLKMISWLDRPDRTHDLQDIAQILDEWLPEGDDRRYEEDVFAASLDHDAVPPFVLGRALATILKPPHRERVARFLARVADEDSHHHYQMRRLGPYGRFDDGDSPVTPRLAAFRQGLGP